MLQIVVGSISKKGGNKSMPIFGKNLFSKKQLSFLFHQSGYTQSMLYISLNLPANTKLDNNFSLCFSGIDGI
jgi:hypothetical protein